MTEIQKTPTEGALVLEFDEALYPKDAVYGAAYIFIDRCYVWLDRPRAGRISVRLKPKAGVSRALEELAGEFENELLGQAWRRMIIDENRQLIEQVTTQALAGAAGPPGLDDLLGTDIDEETAFEDPLGIAMSWEEKYKKKSAGAKAEAQKESAEAAEQASADEPGGEPKKEAG
jgi:His-Xaa-Ser system protein HxsD